LVGQWLELFMQLTESNYLFKILNLYQKPFKSYFQVYSISLVLTSSNKNLKSLPQLITFACFASKICKMETGILMRFKSMSLG
jgi:hypothetical protein